MAVAWKCSSFNFEEVTSYGNHCRQSSPHSPGVCGSLYCCRDVFSASMGRKTLIGIYKNLLSLRGTVLCNKPIHTVWLNKSGFVCITHIDGNCLKHLLLMTQGNRVRFPWVNYNFSAHIYAADIHTCFLMETGTGFLYPFLFSRNPAFIYHLFFPINNPVVFKKKPE
jgi:hypothetical protein